MDYDFPDIATVPGMHARLAEDIEQHNRRCDLLREQIEQHREKKAKAIAKLEHSDGFAGWNRFADAKHDLDRGAMEAMRNLVFLWADRIKTLNEMVHTLDQNLTELEADLETERARVKEKLAEAGVVLESMPGYPANPAAAKVQLQHKIDDTPGVKAIKTQIIEATQSRGRVRRDAAENDSHLDAARQQVRAFADKFVVSI